MIKRNYGLNLFLNIKNIKKPNKKLIKVISYNVPFVFSIYLIHSNNPFIFFCAFIVTITIYIICVLL